MAAASEPNLLKIRLKQSVIERKARAGSLAARRQERLLLAAQRRLKQHQSSLIGQSMYHKTAVYRFFFVFVSAFAPNKN